MASKFGMKCTQDQNHRNCEGTNEAPMALCCRRLARSELSSLVLLLSSSCTMPRMTLFRPNSYLSSGGSL